MARETEIDGETIAKPAQPSPHSPSRTAMRRRARQSIRRREDLGFVIARAVGLFMDVPEADILGRGRKGKAAHARQVAMYLANVALGMSLTRAGRLFERDRTTVAHACQRIEAARDDARFDECLDVLEDGLHRLVKPKDCV